MPDSKAEVLQITSHNILFRKTHLNGVPFAARPMPLLKLHPAGGLFVLSRQTHFEQGIDCLPINFARTKPKGQETWPAYSKRRMKKKEKYMYNIIYNIYLHKINYQKILS